MAIFDERFKELNPQQQKAVKTIEGPVLVIAGPGSGKTEILGLRVANILKETDTHAGSILCLTFADAAAVNMRERLAGLIGRDAYRVAIYTFHRFCVDVINRYPEYFYDGASFMPADEVTQIETLEEIIEELSYDNPLRKEHPEQGFTYLISIRKAIAQLKQAGIAPEEFKKILASNKDALEYVNKEIGIFEERLSIKQLPTIKNFVEYLRAYKEKEKLDAIKSLPLAIAESLEDAIAHAEEDGKTAPLSAWKGDRTIKEEGKRVIGDTIYAGKLEALSEVYEKYIERMHKKGYYDFDDMLLDVLQELERNTTLRYELQERYQYILVDEFQDTNDAQLKLIKFLTDAEVHEGRPNIMAVGDDDQAIYKFQGAEISNILEFKKQFKGVEVITLTHNYRSRQDILDLARHIILKGADRLEKRIDINKDLIAARKDLKGGEIISRTFASSPNEYYWVAGEVKKLIEAGKKPETIAVIARRHSDLQALQAYLSARNIPVSYQRQRNVLLEPHIRQIIQIARFISSIARKNRNEADEYLPEILSFPFWNLDRETVWKFFATAQRDNSLFAAVMHSENKNIRDIGDFLLALATKSQYEPLEYILDEIIGSKSSLLPDDENDDDAEPARAQNDGIPSPFREYYFGKEKFEKNKAEYLSFLSSLRVFVYALREYKQGQFLKIDDLVEFVGLHEKNKLAITDQSSFVSAQSAVHLLSAHSAKGLEFDTVFVLSCQDSIWAAGARGTMVPFPMNLPITPAGDTIDDQLRLFYVAVTRAEHNLYLTSYESDDNDKGSLRLRFLVPGEGEELKENLAKSLSGETVEETGEPEPVNVLAARWEIYNRKPFLPNEEILLQTLVKEYKMSVTHLNNFLNVKEGGPQKFFEQNLLRFPQAKTASGSYGTAMHKSIQLLYSRLKQEGVLPSAEELSEWFEKSLLRERLTKTDFDLYQKRGNDALKKFYDAKKTQFSVGDKIEVNFKEQGVVLGEAHLNGAIDRMVFGGKEIEVHDFKTGKAADNWDGKDSYEKVKLYNYRRQLVFYKILIENSRDFGGKYFVNTGVVEFMEPYHDKIIDLRMEIEKAEVERTEALIAVVYKKIKALDFPDVSKYSPDLKGIQAFEEDLLNGTV